MGSFVLIRPIWLSVLATLVNVAVRAQPMRLKALVLPPAPRSTACNAPGLMKRPRPATRARQPALANPRRPPARIAPITGVGPKVVQLRKGATVSSSGTAGPVGAPSTSARRYRRLAHEGGEVEAHPGGDRLAEVAEGVQVRISAEPIAPLMLQQPALETTALGRPVVHRQPLDDHDHLGDPSADCVCREPIVRERRAGEPGVRRHNGGHVGYDPLDVIASTGRPECPVLDAYVDRKRAA